MTNGTDTNAAPEVAQPTSGSVGKVPARAYIFLIMVGAVLAAIDGVKIAVDAIAELF